MEQQEKFEQNPGPAQGNIHTGLNKGKNKEGHAGSLEGKDAGIEKKIQQQDNNDQEKENSVGIP